MECRAKNASPLPERDPGRTEHMDWSIRKAKIEDQPALADIYLTVRRETFIWADRAQFRLEDFAAHSEGELVWVAEAAGGEIAGFMTLWAADDFIHMLYVRKDWQGAGVGSALLRALPKWPEHGYRLKCLVNNRGAKAFYVAHGFVAVDSGTSPEGDYEELRSLPR
jgi:GNAT superfamily N-acetyltransferase